MKKSISKTGLRMLATIRWHNGILIGGDQDDGRVRKPLVAMGLVEATRLRSGTAQWTITRAGSALLDRLEAE